MQPIAGNDGRDRHSDVQRGSACENFTLSDSSPLIVPDGHRGIEANGGVLVEEFSKSLQHGGKPGLRYRIFFQ
ncbi:MAG: hypothetical protein M3496_01290 [Pseudomonadota bacterium]|nr:hypothetical protein [Burkholderiaceae bacterium]MDQ3444797.1 hypothetical protein [Pseudomonadota bacterium]